MRHRRATVRLTQKPAHARMLKRNLVTSILLYENIRTTKRRAQAIQPLIDSLIHYAKNRPPHVAIRYINREVMDKNACRKIMEVYVKRYSNRTSGLSRIVPAGARKGDNAELVDLVLIDSDIKIEAPAKKEKAEKPARPDRSGGAKKKASTSKKK